MLMNEFKLAIMNNELNNLYVLVGSETKARDIYIEEISKRTKLDIINLDKIEPKLLASSSGLINNNKNIYVVRYDEALLSNENIWPSLINFNKGILLLCYQSLDKRSKFFKRFENNIVDFIKIEPKFLCKKIASLCPCISIEDSDYLSFLCYDDLGRILNEVDKIKSLADEEGVPDLVALNILLENSIPIREEGDTMTFAKAVISRDPKNAIKLLNIIDKNETIGVLSLLYTMFRNNFLVNIYKGSSKGICAGTGLSYNQVQSILPTSNLWSEDEYRANMRLLKRTIENIKKGIISVDIALEYVLIRLL